MSKDIVKIEMSLEDVENKGIVKYCRQNNLKFNHLIWNEEKEMYDITLVKQGE